MNTSIIFLFHKLPSELSLANPPG